MSAAYMLSKQVMTRPKQQKSVSGITCEGANLAGRKTNDFLNRVLLLRCGQLEYDVIIQLLRRRNAAQIWRFCLEFV